MAAEPVEQRPFGARTRRQEPERLEAFSDGVLAVIITIMVLELKAPTGAHWSDLRQLVPGVLAYLLSFVFIGIYWNNHHHLLRSTRRIDARVMWMNLHLLFWLSLIPVVTEWVGRQYRAHLPASIYGAVALGCGVAYSLLCQAIIRANGADSAVARAIGRDVKGYTSLALYLVGVAAAWVSPWISYACFVAVSVTWFFPDRRIEAAEAASLSDT